MLYVYVEDTLLRKFLVLVMTLMFCLFTGCGKTNREASASQNNYIETTVPTSKDNNIDSNYFELKRFNDNTHLNSTISIHHPVFLQDNTVFLNEQILEFVKSLPGAFYGDDYENLTLELDGELLLNSSQYLSIAFYGFGNIKTAAHPSKLYETFNFDLTADKRIILKDICIIDITFA